MPLRERRRVCRAVKKRPTAVSVGRFPSANSAVEISFPQGS